jgi:hypothetical protein
MATGWLQFNGLQIALRDFHVEICDREGWRRFVVSLPDRLVERITREQAVMTMLRKELDDDRFLGHAMVIAPC